MGEVVRRHLPLGQHVIANRFGVGFQIPLGLVFIGGPLVDAGHTVQLIDNDLYGWNSGRLVEEVRRFAPDFEESRAGNKLAGVALKVV